MWAISSASETRKGPENQVASKLQTTGTVGAGSIIPRGELGRGDTPRGSHQAMEEMTIVAEQDRVKPAALARLFSICWLVCNYR